MFKIITANQIRATQFENVISNGNVMDCHALDRPLLKAGNVAHKAGETELAEVCGLFAAICSMYFRPDDPTEPFGPRIAMGDGRRSMIGSDLPQEQLDALKEVCVEITNLPIRTRVADVIWTMDKSAPGFGRTAIDGYVGMTNALIDGTGVDQFQKANPSGVTTEKYIARAAVIAQRTGWQKSENGPLRTAALACFEHAKSHGNGNDKARLGRLMFRLGLVAATELAATLAPFVQELLLIPDYSQASALQNLIIELQRKSKNVDAYRAAVLVLVGILENEADAHKIGILKTHSIETAIAALNDVTGVTEKRAALHEKLRDAQVNIMEGMRGHSLETDISHIVEAALDDFSGLDLLDSLELLARRAAPPSPEGLTQEAREELQHFPFSGIFSTRLLDEKSRTIARANGGRFDAPSDDELRHKIIQHEGMRIGLSISGCLYPVREKLTDEHRISLELMHAIASVSPFVAKGTELIFARGMLAFLYGDHLVAAALLVPYLERGLRSLVEVAGHLSTSISTDGIETSRGLGPLLSKHRDVMEQVLGKPNIFCIENHFVHDFGPKVRHMHCHGLLSDGFYYGRDSIYSCWLIFSLVFSPLAGDWPRIKQHIQQQM